MAITSRLVSRAIVSGVMVRKIVAGQEQRRGKHRPQAHVRAVLVGLHAAVADFQHVRIVPVARPGVFREARLAEADAPSCDSSRR